MLFHGPPGCGKTLMARAVAQEAGARFINLDVASLTDKWYGESQKLSSAVFSLAAKIQPCIIFIDEIGKTFYLISKFMFLQELLTIIRNLKILLIFFTYLV